METRLKCLSSTRESPLPYWIGCGALQDGISWAEPVAAKLPAHSAGSECDSCDRVYLDIVVARRVPFPFGTGGWKGQQVISEAFPRPGRAREHLVIGFGAQHNNGRFAAAVHNLRRTIHGRFDDGGESVLGVLKRPDHDDPQFAHGYLASKEREVDLCPHH